MNKPTEISPKFEQLINKVWSNPRISQPLLMIDYAAVLLSVIAFAARVAVLAVAGDFIALIGFISVLAVSFIAVSVFRKIINMPRPYELCNIERIDSSKKRGESFPSRHVFSAFIIATVLTEWNIWISAGLFIVGSLMAVVRVVIGRHFVRDVVAGALIGVVAGVIGLLII